VATIIEHYFGKINAIDFYININAFLVYSGFFAEIAFNLLQFSRVPINPINPSPYLRLQLPLL
jgi:hypothetical protein